VTAAQIEVASRVQGAAIVPERSGFCRRRTETLIGVGLTLLRYLNRKRFVSLISSRADTIL
jgi:hypothetical protein